MGTTGAALALPDKPSVAVLPFTNMSGEAAQEYFADGITDDIITELSRFSELFVIARNSGFSTRADPSKRAVFLSRHLRSTPTMHGLCRALGCSNCAWSARVDADYLAPAALDGAHDFARRALQIDPNLPQAHACLGVVPAAGTRPNGLKTDALMSPTCIDGGMWTPNGRAPHPERRLRQHAGEVWIADGCADIRPARW